MKQKLYIQKNKWALKRARINANRMENYEPRIWKGIALALLFACVLMCLVFHLMFKYGYN